jgi:hypothetical protein
VAVLPATLAHTVANLLVPDDGTGDRAAVADVAGLRADLIAQLPASCATATGALADPEPTPETVERAVEALRAAFDFDEALRHNIAQLVERAEQARRCSSGRSRSPTAPGRQG